MRKKSASAQQEGQGGSKLRRRSFEDQSGCAPALKTVRQQRGGRRRARKEIADAHPQLMERSRGRMPEDERGPINALIEDLVKGHGAAKPRGGDRRSEKAREDQLCGAAQLNGKGGRPKKGGKENRGGASPVNGTPRRRPEECAGQGGSKERRHSFERTGEKPVRRLLRA